jgi:hypothetical protein
LKAACVALNSCLSKASSKAQQRSYEAIKHEALSAKAQESFEVARTSDQQGTERLQEEFAMMSTVKDASCPAIMSCLSKISTKAQQRAFEAIRQTAIKAKAKEELGEFLRKQVFLNSQSQQNEAQVMGRKVACAVIRSALSKLSTKAQHQSLEAIRQAARLNADNPADDAALMKVRRAACVALMSCCNKACAKTQMRGYEAIKQAARLTAENSAHDAGPKFLKAACVALNSCLSKASSKAQQRSYEAIKHEALSAKAQESFEVARASDRQGTEKQQEEFAMMSMTVKDASCPAIMSCLSKISTKAQQRAFEAIRQAAIKAKAKEELGEFLRKQVLLNSGRQRNEVQIMGKKAACAVFRSAFSKLSVKAQHQSLEAIRQAARLNVDNLADDASQMKVKKAACVAMMSCCSKASAKTKKRGYEAFRQTFLNAKAQDSFEVARTAEQLNAERQETALMDTACVSMNACLSKASARAVQRAFERIRQAVQVSNWKLKHDFSQFKVREAACALAVSCLCKLGVKTQQRAFEAIRQAALPRPSGFTAAAILIRKDLRACLRRRFMEVVEMLKQGQKLEATFRPKNSQGGTAKLYMSYGRALLHRTLQKFSDLSQTYSARLSHAALHRLRDATRLPSSKRSNRGHRFLVRKALAGFARVVERRELSYSWKVIQLANYRQLLAVSLINILDMFHDSSHRSLLSAFQIWRKSARHYRSMTSSELTRLTRLTANLSPIEGSRRLVTLQTSLFNKPPKSYASGVNLKEASSSRGDQRGLNLYDGLSSHSPGVSKASHDVTGNLCGHLPMPASIHDYIDDIISVGSQFEDTQFVYSDVFEDSQLNEASFAGNTYFKGSDELHAKPVYTSLNQLRINLRGISQFSPKLHFQSHLVSDQAALPREVSLGPRHSVRYSM